MDESWVLLTQDGESVASSPTYADGLTEDLQELCLPAGSYEFIISDVYQDGMCCDWGEGSYTVTSGQNVIADGGAFGASESTPFTLPI